MYQLFPIDTFMVSYYIYGRHRRTAPYHKKDGRVKITKLIPLFKQEDPHKLDLGVFLDSSKAFHSLDHTILLDKLLNYWIKGTELAWFKSYLTYQIHFVSYDGTNSRPLFITTGVPQGSILVPFYSWLIWMIFIMPVQNFILSLPMTQT